MGRKAGRGIGGVPSPCEGCKDRFVTEDGQRCHTTCTKYKEYRKKLEVIRSNHHTEDEYKDFFTVKAHKKHHR